MHFSGFSAPPLRTHTVILAASSSNSTMIVRAYNWLGIVRRCDIVLAVLSIHIWCLLGYYGLRGSLVKMSNRRLRLHANMSLCILATGMILRYHLLLLLFFHVDWLCNHVSMVNGVNFLIIFHKKSLRVNPPMLNDILYTRIVPINVFKVIAYQNAVFRTGPLYQMA